MNILPLHNPSHILSYLFTHLILPVHHLDPVQHDFHTSRSLSSCLYQPCPTCAIHPVPPVLHPVDETDEVLAVGLEVVAEDAAVLLLHEHDLKVG